MANDDAPPPEPPVDVAEYHRRMQRAREVLATTADDGPEAA